jgi:hypothetical protein
MLEQIPNSLKTVSDYAGLTRDVAAVVGILGGAAWFGWQGLFKQRTQADIDCRFHKVEGNPSFVLAEILVSFQNKGYVQQALEKFEIEIRTLDAEDLGLTPGTSLGTAARFGRAVITEGLVCTPPGKWRFFRIRPAVQSVITQTALIPANLDLIQISINFDNNRVAASLWTTTLRRVFKLPAKS